MNTYILANINYIKKIQIGHVLSKRILQNTMKKKGGSKKS